MNAPFRAAAAAALFAAATAHAAVTYSTINLDPAVSFGSRGFAAAGLQQAGDASPNTPSRAFLWNSTASSFVNLHPAGFTADNQATSYVNGMSLTRQVGYVSSDFYYGNANYHAFAWSGTAASAVDLHPAGYTSSLATATSGNQTVGQVRGAATSNTFHAALWTGNSTDVVDLNPMNQVNANTTIPAQNSFANAVAGGVQVGTAMVYRFNTSTNPKIHAYTWTGTAESAIDLNPAGFDQSYALATTGTQHGGKGISIAGPTHALLWTSSSPASAIDLQPAGFDSSEIHGMAPGIQVGYGFNLASLRTHALVWFDSAASAVDLNTFLPAGYTSSQALAVTPEGYIVGTATSDTETNAFLWIPGNQVPEPAPFGLLITAAAATLARRRR